MRRATTRTCSTSSTTSAGRSRCRRSLDSAAAAACCSSRTARCRCSASARRRSRSARSATGRSSVSTRRCRCRTARCSCRTRRGSRRSNGCRCAHAGSASVLGRTAELLVQRIRGRVNGVGAALQSVKRGIGRAAGALDVRRANVGDIGFNLDEVDLAMSRVSERLLDRFDFADIRRRRDRELPAARRAARPRHRRASSETCPTASARCSSRSSCPTSTRPRGAAAARRRRPRVLERQHGIGRRDGPGRAVPARARPRAADSSGPDAAPHRVRGARRSQPVATGWLRDDAVTQAVVRRTRRPATRFGWSRSTPPGDSTALRPQWNELLHASAREQPVSHVGMAACLVDAPAAARRAPASSPCGGDELIAVAPLDVAPHAPGWFSRLEFLGTGHAGSDYLDLIVRRGHEADALARLRGFLEHAEMRAAARPSAARLAGRAARRAARRRRLDASTTPDGVCPVIHLAGHTLGFVSGDARLGASRQRPPAAAGARAAVRACASSWSPTEAAAHEALDALAGFHERRFGSRAAPRRSSRRRLRAFHRRRDAPRARARLAADVRAAAERRDRGGDVRLRLQRPVLLLSARLRRPVSARTASAWC